MDYTTFDDETLVRLIARLDRGAFEVLYDRHAGLVLGLTYRILGEKRQSEDIAQEAFWRVWKGAAEVRAALAQLPDAQRQVIELAYYKGLTHVQIAEQMGLPAGTIHTRARLAMQKLRDALIAPTSVPQR